MENDISGGGAAADRHQREDFFAHRIAIKRKLALVARKMTVNTELFIFLLEEKIDSSNSLKVQFQFEIGSFAAYGRMFELDGREHLGAHI